jgi:hypothetical protein
MHARGTDNQKEFFLFLAIMVHLALSGDPGARHA